MLSLSSVWNTPKNSQKKKITDDVKDELLRLLANSEKNAELGLHNEVRNAKNPKEAKNLIKASEEILKGHNKKIINIARRQGELLKMFKKPDGFLDRIGLSRPNIYFKKSLFKFLFKFLLLESSTLLSLKLNSYILKLILK